MIVIVGESACGKSSVAKCLVNNYGYKRIVTYTTRKPRDGEVDGFDYFFINQEEFEKDHDENGHIDFIHAGAILRARNYKIEECDRNYTKQISGNIIPTILTTTASIAAVSSIQLYTSFQTNENIYRI